MSFQLASLVAGRLQIAFAGPVDEAAFRWEESLSAEFFAGRTWLEIEDVESIDAIGIKAIPAERTAKNVANATTMTRKVGRQYRPAEAVFAMKPWLPGQAALLAAEGSFDAYAFRIRFADAPAGGTPSERLIVATIGSLEERIGGPNDQPKLAVALWPHHLVRVHAAEGVAP